MALYTTLYIQHGKAKAKATEVTSALTQLIGRSIPIEYDWKFVDNAGFKSHPTDEQKRIIVDVMGNNLSQCIVAPGDSLASACSASPPLRDMVGTVTKILFNFDYANSINNPIGAPFLNISLDGTTLNFKSNLNAIQSVNNGDWDVVSKLLSLVGSAPVTPSVMTPTPTPTATPVATPVVASPSVVAKPSASVQITPPPQSFVAAPAAQPAAGGSSSGAKYARAGGKPGGQGGSTFLYMTVDKLKKRVTEMGKELSNRLGTSVTVELDLNSLIKDSNFTKESEADQKGILMGPVWESIPQALFSATNGNATVESALKSSPGLNKVKWSYAPSVTPTSGWGFFEVSGAGNELLLKCAITSADEYYASQGGSSGAPVSVPMQAAAPAVQASPVAVRHPQPSHVPMAAPAASSSSPAAVSTPPAGPSTPVPGSRMNKVGGPAGGNGSTGFLYTPLEKFKRLVSDTYNKEFANQIASTRVSVSIDATFAKNPSFTKLSEADQRAIVLGPMADNVAQILWKSPSGDHMAALFKNPKYIERCLKITKIIFQWATDVSSSEGFKFCEFVWAENGTDILFRINIEDIDVYFEAATWAISAKAHEGIFGIEKRAAEAAKALEERRAMAALEASAKQNMAEAERRAAEEKALQAKLAEQERVRKELESSAAERIKLLEDSNVTGRLKENQERLAKMISMCNLSGTVTYEVDNLFIHDKKLRWRDCGTQKTTLKSISIESWSLFNVITDAAILILESGDVGRNKFMESFHKFNLQFEVADASVKVPRMAYDSSTKTMNIFATFSNLYDPRKWIDELTAGISEKQIYQGTTIAEIFKAILTNSAGWMEDMARDESTNKINDILYPYFKTHFEGRLVPIEVDWTALDGQNASQSLIVRLKKHYQFPSCVLEVLFKSFAISNSVVMKILRAKLKKIRVVASGSNSIVIEGGGETMVVSYKWADQTFSEKQWKAAVEEQVRQKCQGLTVKNVSAEISMAEAEPTILDINRTLCAKLGMISHTGGYDVLVVDYPSFVDTLEFGKAHGASNFEVLHRSNLSALQSLLRGFEDVSRTTLGGPLLKTVKSIKVTLDVKSRETGDDALLKWDPATKTFSVTHHFSSFEHPASYNYTPRLEYTLGILIESCRVETKQGVEKFYQTVRADFGLNSLPVLIDESYQQTKAFTDIHPSKMKAIVMRMFTTLPPSIFHGPMGLKHCSEFPKAKAILHNKVKSIRLLPDGLLASNTSKVELTPAGELLVRVAFDNKDWTVPIGYRLSEIIGSRPTIEKEVIEEIDSALIGYTNNLRTISKNSKITVGFDWNELLADSTFQAAQNYVNDYVRYVLGKIKIAFEGTSAIYDAGLVHYIQKENLGPALAPFENLIFHMSTTNQISTQGKFGLFTPYYYDVSKNGKELHVRVNYKKYPVGCGSIVEWVINPTSAAARQDSFVKSISVRNYNEEIERREDAVRRTHASNESDMRRYNEDVQEYNRDMKKFAETPGTKKCTSCSGKGYWGSRLQNKCSHCGTRGWVEVKKKAPVMPTAPSPRPIPTFPPTCVADFTKGLNRGELRTGHYAEGYNSVNEDGSLELSSDDEDDDDDDDDDVDEDDL